MRVIVRVYLGVTPRCRGTREVVGQGRADSRMSEQVLSLPFTYTAVT